MVQNVKTGSGAAKRAIADAKIVWFMPLDCQGLHTRQPFCSDWGCIEDGEVVKNCPAILNQQDVQQHYQAHGKRYSTPPKRKVEAKIYLECDFKDKDEVKDQGAKWDPGYKKWWVLSSISSAKLVAFTKGEIHDYC